MLIFNLMAVVLCLLISIVAMVRGLLWGEIPLAITGIILTGILLFILIEGIALLTTV